VSAPLKHTAELLLVRTGVTELVRRIAQPRDLVLAYHNVLPTSASAGLDASLHLAIADFRQQLDRLVRTHEVVPLATLLSPATPRSGRPRAAITFDDAYRGAVTAAVGELAARDLPATIFVAPAFVGGKSFWWDSLVPGSEGSPFSREHALVELRGEDASIRAWGGKCGLRASIPPPWAVCATEEELGAALLRHPGLTLGSHSWSHPNLAALPESDLFRELARPLAWLRERFERVVPWLAYPYGLTSPAVERASARAGYAAALRVTGGRLPLDPALEQYTLPRYHVPAQISRNGFDLRLAGLFFPGEGRP
jgi:peptidoglycan/xylan/chitin deacetylase (PgdA/CDA1 family)